ncbi:MAG: hypothetical protein CMO10_06190 [Thalassospira sp.]|nr:hypothetical protein [Thalassospira sp.]
MSCFGVGVVALDAGPGATVFSDAEITDGMIEVANVTAAAMAFLTESFGIERDAGIQVWRNGL